jgi:predicted PolB exonuclease-like 3'-5' exonuclease
VLKLLAPRIYCWDAEWIPDVDTGRRLLDLADDMPDADVLAAMFEYGGATQENPRPYLKTALCRIVSIAAVKRTQRGDDVTHEIAAACRIPGKGSTSGGDVLSLWQAGRVDEIVRYNQRDAITTYLVLLRVLHLAGKVDLAAEEQRVVQLLETLGRTEGNAHLRAFLEEWRPGKAVAA